MTIYGYQLDSILPLPAAVPLQAHYVNGTVSKWRGPVEYKPGWVWIDVLATAPEAAFWLDVEQGDATPAAVPGWLDARESAGLGAGGVYCNRSTLPAVVSAIGHRAASLWLAAPGALPTPESLSLPASITLCAVQVAGFTLDGTAVDVSAVVDEAYWGRAA